MTETARLLLRPVEPSDWRSVQWIANDFRSGPYMLYDSAMPDTDEGVREKTVFFAKSGAVYAAVRKEDMKMIGYVCMWRNPDFCEMGYCFHSSCHRMGYGYEACSALMSAMKAQGVKAFVAGTAIDNVPSMRLLEKLGFEMISRDRTSFHKDAQGNDIYFQSGVFLKWMGKNR